MKVIFGLLVLTLLCVPTYADKLDNLSINYVDLTHLKFADLSCQQSREEYKKAILKITKTSSFKKLKLNLDPHFKIVFGGFMRDKSVFWRKNCYISVSIYIDRGDRLELREVFLVTRNLKNIYKEQPDGNYEHLKISN